MHNGQLFDLLHVSFLFCLFFLCWEFKCFPSYAVKKPNLRATGVGAVLVFLCHVTHLHVSCTVNLEVFMTDCGDRGPAPSK